MSAPPLPWEIPRTEKGSPKADIAAARDALNRATDPMTQSATLGDVHDILSGADLAPAAEALEAAVENALKAKMAGKQVVVTTTSVSGHQIKLSDAKNRAFRTLFQNLGIDLLVALGTVLPMLTTMNFTDKTAWVIFGVSVLKTIVSVFVSYVSRLTAEPVIPTPVETTSGQIVQPLPRDNAAG